MMFNEYLNHSNQCSNYYNVIRKDEISLQQNDTNRFKQKWIDVSGVYATSGVKSVQSNKPNEQSNMYNQQPQPPPQPQQQQQQQQQYYNQQTYVNNPTNTNRNSTTPSLEQQQNKTQYYDSFIPKSNEQQQQQQYNYYQQYQQNTTVNQQMTQNTKQRSYYPQQTYAQQQQQTLPQQQQQYQQTQSNEYSTATVTAVYHPADRSQTNSPNPNSLAMSPMSKQQSKKCSTSSLDFLANNNVPTPSSCSTSSVMSPQPQLTSAKIDSPKSWTVTPVPTPMSISQTTPPRLQQHTTNPSNSMLDLSQEFDFNTSSTSSSNNNNTNNNNNNKQSNDEINIDELFMYFPHVFEEIFYSLKLSSIEQIEQELRSYLEQQFKLNLSSNSNVPVASSNTNANTTNTCSTSTANNNSTSPNQQQHQSQPYPKRIKITNEPFITSPNKEITSDLTTRAKRLASMKSSPVLTQVVSAKPVAKLSPVLSQLEEKNKNILIESLNIIEPLSSKSKQANKTSPNKPSKQSSNSSSSKTTTSALYTNRNSFACLRNLGSTCYINCIIQVMRYTPGFVLSINRLNKQIDYLKSLKNPDIDIEINRNNEITFVKSLHELLVEMSKIEQSDRRPIYTPRKFVNTVWTSLSFWSDGSQQDAHEFLQYTIHFINECDLYIRKIQQQYQVKQIPHSNETMTAQETKCVEPKLPVRNMRPTRKPTKPNEPPPPPPSNNVLIELSDKKQLEPILNNLALLTDESSSSSTSSTCSSSASSTSAISSSTYQTCLIKTDPISRLIKAKSSDNTNNTNNNNNFLRTPTKGGASSFNLTMLDSLTNSKNSISQSSSNMSGSTSLPSRANKREAQDELIFRPMIKSENGELTKREPIKVKFQLDKSNENYRIVNSTAIKKSPNNLIIDYEKDLVSKRLKETLNCSFETRPKQQKIDQEAIELTNKNKRFKQEIKQNSLLFSHLSDLDTSNIIIMDDSDDNDDDVYFMDDDEMKYDLKNPIITQNTIKTQEEVFKEKLSDEENYELKDCYVLLEKLDNQSIKSFSRPPLAKESEVKPEELIENNKEPEKAPVVGLKKLKSKSKTFPQTQIETIQNVYADLDAITILSTVRHVNSNQQSNSNYYESNNLRSKLRSNSSSQVLKSPAVLPSINTAPPSPAELLRKYSTGIGYTCEMDKLFKGSSITVTQCLECETLRKCPESFYDRSIPIETTECIEDESSCWIAKCLSNESYLNENSKYMCDQCASKQEAKIHTQYTQMPNILILHLLSYGITSSDDGNLNTRKLSNRLRLVNYFDFVCKKDEQFAQVVTNGDGDVFKSPVTTRRQLQIKKDSSKESNEAFKHQFRLFAVVMHSGVSLNSGHYTAFVNYKIISQRENSTIYDNIKSNMVERSSPIENSNTKVHNGSFNDHAQTEWLHFDDTKVKSLSNNEFQRKIVDSNYDSPYILFYVRD